MNYDNPDRAPGAPTVAAPAAEMRFSVENIKRWMTTEIHLRIARGWLVTAGVAAVALALIAID